MIIYHVITVFHLLSCLVHKTYYHEKENAILIIPDFMQDRIDMDRFDELVDANIFSQVIVFPHRKLGGEYDQIIKNALNAFRKIFSGMNLKENKIYVFGAHFYFTIGLVDQRIGYEVFEEASGGYTHPEILLDAVRNSSPVMEEICNSFNTLSYRNECIKRIWIDYGAQEGEFDKTGTIHYSVMECLQEIGDERKEKLYSFFRVPQINVTNKAAILLTQHFMNLNIMTYDEQIELYKTYIDSFLYDQEIYIKPHPNDLMDYETHLKKCKIIKGRFPFELFAVRKSEKLSTVATVYSSSVYTVDKLFENMICLDMNYRETYKYFYQYYLGMKIIEKLFTERNDWICQGIGIDFKSFQELLKHRSKLQIDVNDMNAEVLEGRSINLIGICKPDLKREKFVKDILECVGENNITIFFNLDKRALGYLHDKSMLEYIIPIKICINTKDYNIWNQKEIVMYLYVKERELREKMKNLNIHEEFSNLETILDVKPMSEEQIRIKVLEGILQATEKRLLEELNKNKEKSGDVK